MIVWNRENKKQAAAAAVMVIAGIINNLMQEGAEVHIIIQDAKDGIRDDSYLSNSKRAVSYTHLDVYKRQLPYPARKSRPEVHHPFGSPFQPHPRIEPPDRPRNIPRRRRQARTYPSLCSRNVPNAYSPT